APGEDPDQLVVEVVGGVADVAGHTVSVHLTAAFDVFLQPLVDVLVPPPLVHLRLVVELDLADHEAGEALGVLVGLLLLGGVGPADGGRTGPAGRAARGPGRPRGPAARAR